MLQCVVEWRSCRWPYCWVVVVVVAAVGDDDDMASAAAAVQDDEMAPAAAVATQIAAAAVAVVAAVVDTTHRRPLVADLHTIAVAMGMLPYSYRMDWRRPSNARIAALAAAVRHAMVVVVAAVGPCDIVVAAAADTRDGY